MKKFLSMALAAIMAFNVNVLSSKNIAAADFWDGYCYVEEGNYRSDNLNFDIPKDDLKGKNKIKITVEKEEESSKLKTFLKFISWAAYTALLAYVGFTVATFSGLNENTQKKIEEFANSNNKVLNNAINKTTGFYNNITSNIQATYNGFCPKDTTNGVFDCVLKNLRFRPMANTTTAQPNADNETDSSSKGQK